jgi:2-haloalkanoic acid dehalogenase type II
MSLKLRIISLDLDNTLWDTPPVLARAEAVLQAWLARHYPRIVQQFPAGDLQRLRAELAQAHRERAHDLSWLRTEALRRAALASGYGAQAGEAAFEVFLAARNDIEPYAEVRPALARLAARWPLYALSNGNACVRRAGLGQYFRGAIDAGQAGAAKPDARIFVQLLAAAGAAADEVLHVGDDAIADVAGARDVGMRTAWMNRTQSPWPAAVARADHEVRDLIELADLVEQLAGE